MHNKLIKSLILILFFSINTFGQTYNHTTFWSRLGFQKEVKNWDFRLEFDYRTQNDFQKSMINPFQKRFLQWFRVSTAYKTGNFQHTIILPNLIKNYPLAANLEDLKRFPTTEWRIGLFEEIDLQKTKFTTSFRAGYEYRMQNSNNIKRNTGRIRFRVNEIFQISDKSRLNLSIEPLYNIGPNKAPNTFSQTQLQFRYAHRFGKNVNLTTGLVHLFRKRASLIEYDIEQGLICNLQIGL